MDQERARSTPRPRARCARVFHAAGNPRVRAHRTAPADRGDSLQTGQLARAWFARLTLLTAVIISLLAPTAVPAESLSRKQQSLQEWREFTAPDRPSPRVFVKGNRIRFYFPSASGVEGFKADWDRLRIHSPDYRVNSALLEWDKRLPRVPRPDRDWREARVIAGPEWQRIATNLISALTPAEPLHAAFYQAFLAEGVLYRDRDGVARLAESGRVPPEVVVDHRYSIQATLEILAREIESRLAAGDPSETLFLIMVPNRQRLTQSLLLDLKQRECVWLTPAALYDTTEGGLGLSTTAQNVGAMVVESHGIALLKNPVSSVARLADLGVQTSLRFLRRPLPRANRPLPEPGVAPGMDLAGWEKWLDTYTGTRRLEGSIKLLIGGDRFFPRLSEAIATATNHVHFDIYIFDRDDIGVAVADKLKVRSRDVEVQLVIDRMGSLAASAVAPATPMPEDFVPPTSIFSYLKHGSAVQVRSFLNPWFSADHAKVFLVDGTHAWLGGMNLGREYRYEWLDLMVELQGPVVGVLEENFSKVWAHSGPLGDLAYVARAIRKPKRQPPAPGPWTQVRLLPTRTAWKPFATAVLGSFRKARNHIYVTHPYLFDKRVLTGLVEARRRGVDVRVVLPRVNDFVGGTRSNVVTANYLLKHGVRVYFHPGMFHTKAVLVDGWSCVGSANLNHLSLRLCQEQNVATSDPEFAAALKAGLFDGEFAKSYELEEPLSVSYVDFLMDLVLENF